MINILLLSHRFYPEIGGIESVSEMMGDSLSKAGYTVRLLTWTVATGDKNFAYEVVRNPSVSQLIGQLKWADVVFENNPCLRLSWPNLFMGKPQLTSLHTWITRPTGKKQAVDYLKLFLLKRSDLVTACSEAVRKNCYPDAVVVTNPYNDRLFRRNPSVGRTADFVFLGRLVSDKGVIVAIEALHRLSTDRQPDGRPFTSTLTIIGDGPERPALEKAVDTLGLRNNVLFRGNLRGNALVDALNEHRCLLIPSLWQEPFGVVALEGMACGCVPIASNIGGLPDAIGEAGLTVEPGNVDALAIRMREFLSDPLLENRLRPATDDHLRAHRQDAIAGVYSDLMWQILGKSEPQIELQRQLQE